LLHQVIFNIFVKKVLRSLFAYLIKEDVQNVLLPAWKPCGTAPLGNSIVDNPLIQSRPHANLHSYNIMASKPSRFESCQLESVERYARASLPDTNPWCKRSQATFVGCVGGCG